jgi:fatty acid-binding protein DegV
MTVRVVTDSTCDLPADIIASHNIAVVPLYINGQPGLFGWH